ncbi:MAG TPA: GNAT family N-acetyltransferase [Pyrinomonadaceae bacterium]|nr:GNAT family N-acetyltransferase [Pyrinomonadaceae bacterium]
MGYGWEGALVRLVPLEKERHLENCLRWCNDPQVTETTLMGDVPLSRFAEEEFFDEMAKPSKAPSDIVLAVETLDRTAHIGLAGLHAINWRHQTAQTGTLIGESDFRGRGFGRETSLLRTRYAFEVLGLRMLVSEVFAENTASLRMLKASGYVEAGRIPRRYWKRGAYRDVVILYAERDAP